MMSAGLLVLITLLVVLAAASHVRAQDVKRDIPYAETPHER